MLHRRQLKSLEYSNIFYIESTGANKGVTDAVSDFFKAADSSMDDNPTDAQHSAIQGAKSLIMAAIDGILGDTSIGAREVASFNVIFLNNSFVRINRLKITGSSNRISML